MKKYTIKEFAEGKKAVKIENKEQWNKLNKVHKLCGFLEDSSNIYYTNKDSWERETYLSNTGWETLEFSQLDFEDEFVVKKWYKITKEDNNTKYIKYSKTSHIGYFECSEHVYLSEYKKYGGTFGINESKYLTKASLEEIQQYLPSNHPDLIKKDTFVLPEYWYVVVTKENKEILSRWRFNNQPCLNLDGYIGGIVGLLPKYPNSRNHNTSKDKDWNRSIEITFEQFKTHILKESTMNTFGLKVGDPLPKEVIREWALVEGCYDYEQRWRKREGTFDSNRKIETIKEIDGISAFQPTGCGVMWLKCEGFLEFKESFNKEKTMEKEIIGYKLKNVKYLEATKELIKSLGGKFGDDGWWDENAANNLKEKGWNFANGTNYGSIAQIMKEAGVLDLWFERVYAPEYKIGEWISYSNAAKTKTITSKLKEWTNHRYCILENGTEPFKDVIRKSTEDEIKKAQIQLPTINGKQCVDNGDKTITCGCTTKSFDWILGVEYAMGDDIYISDTKVTQKEIKQIVEYINKK